MMQENEAQKPTEPINSDVQWANRKQEIKEMFNNKSMREIAIRDFEYGLSREDIMLYADKQHLPLANVEQLSRALKVHDGRELVNYLRDSGLNAYQMELIVDFYKKGVSLDKIREVMGQEQTAYSLSQALQKVYEALYQAGKSAEENGVQEIQGKIEAVVAQVGENKAFLDQVLSKLEEIDAGQNTDALSQSFIEKLEEKDGIIRSQQEENNKLAADNAALRSRQGEAAETQERQKEEKEKFRQEKAGLLEQIKQAETEKSDALARLDAAGKEKEAMERKLESMEREMEAVKKQLEQAKEKGSAIPDKTAKADAKRLAGNYQVLVSGPGGRQAVEVERAERKNPAGIMAMAGKLWKDKGRGKLLQAIAGAGLDGSQMEQVKNALQSGLTDDEIINVIRCGFDAEQMGKAIEIVLLERMYNA
ncbi:MAG: hypothetical protein NC489_39855 [Ruminococcus flavefaciens]|nr:hypothetical protein [Ruminococcus flavefaciens]